MTPPKYFFYNDDDKFQMDFDANLNGDRRFTVSVVYYGSGIDPGWEVGDTVEADKCSIVNPGLLYLINEHEHGRPTTRCRHCNGTGKR